MLENIQVLYHSSIKINKEKVIYIDPFKIVDDCHDADPIDVYWEISKETEDAF